MFSRFHIDLCQDFFRHPRAINRFRRIGEIHLNKQKAAYIDEISDFFTKDIVSAEEIGANWFPQINVDVFLSHSRDDKRLVQAFAGWLNDTFGLNCFVDSNVWNHANTLINVMDKNYEAEGLTPFQRASSIFSQVHVILGLSLQKLMDKTEAVFLVNAGNAVHFSDQTYSPWISWEVSCMNLMRTKPLLAYRTYDNYQTPVIESHEHGMQMLLEYMMVSHQLDLDGLEYLDSDKLNEWAKDFCENDCSYEYALDALYHMTRYKDSINQTRVAERELPADSVQMLQEAWNASGDSSRQEQMQIIQESLERIRKMDVKLEPCRRYDGCSWCLRHSW